MVEAALDELAARYRDRTLNDLPEFEGLNPSIEHLPASSPMPSMSGLTARHWMRLS